MTTPTNELLYWQHIEDEDFEGAEEHLPDSADQLKASADNYLNGAVAVGEVDRSRIFFNRHLGKHAGYTMAETPSGVTIVKSSNGDLTVRAEFEEHRPGAGPGDWDDVQLEASLREARPPFVHESRNSVVDYERTGESTGGTLSKPKSEQAMDEIRELIRRTYE